MTIKNAQVQFNSDKVVQFYAVNYLEDCTVQTEMGQVECDIIIVPKTVFKDAKPKMDENGDLQPSKGVRANVSAKSGDEWGMAFQNGLGMQLSIYKMNEKPKARESIFASEEGEA